MVYGIAQLIGFIAFFLSLIAYHKDKKEKILGSMVISNVLNLVHYILLGAYSGCVTKVVAIFRDGFIILKNKHKRLDSKLFLVLFVMVYIVCAIVTYKSIYSVLPLVAAIIYIISIWNGNEKQIKKTALFTYFLWLAYNICVLSIAGVVSNIVSIISTFIAVKRCDSSNNFGSSSDIESETECLDYEAELEKNSLSADKMHKNVKLLVIADAHGTLHFHEELVSVFKDEVYDLCCVLGDMTDADYDVILKYVPKDKIVALLGNHDRLDILEKYNILDLNGKVIESNGVKIGGIQGSHKYKNEEYAMYTHEESIKLLDKMEKVDILLSHDKPFTLNTQDNVHDGLKGITKYLYDKQVAINIHGHIHERYEKKLKNGTIEKSVYLCELINIQNGKIM